MYGLEEHEGTPYVVLANLCLREPQPQACGPSRVLQEALQLLVHAVRLP